MSETAGGRKRRVQPLVILLLVAVSASLVVTAGVTAQENGDADEELEPADQIIVEEGQVILIYEEGENDENIVGAEFGADTTNGILYGNFRFGEDVSESQVRWDGNAELTEDALTAEVEGTIEENEQLREDVKGLSAEFDLVQSETESNFDLSAEGVVQEQAPAQISSSGDVVVRHDQMQVEGDVRAESLLLRNHPSADISAEITETSDGFTIDVEHTQEGSDLREFATENVTRRSLRTGAEQFAGQYGGSSAVTVHSHQFERGENISRVDMSYTIELRDIRDSFATMTADQIAEDEDLADSEHAALERLLSEVELERLSIDVEKTTDGVVTADASMAVGNYNDPLLAFLRAGVEADDDASTEELEQIEAVLDAQEASGLSQTLGWDLRIEPARTGTDVSLDAAYEASNWGQFIDEVADTEGLQPGTYLFSGEGLEFGFAMEDTGEAIRVDSDLRVSEPTKPDSEGAPDDVFLTGPLSADSDTRPNVFVTVPDGSADGEVSNDGLPEDAVVLPVELGRLDVTTDERTQVEFGVDFADRHGPMRALGLALADRHGPLRMPDRHGPMRMPDRHGPMRLSGVTDEGVPVNHFFVESDGDTTTTYVYLGLPGASEQQIRDSPVADENTEFVTREDRDPQQLDVDTAGEYLGVEVVDPSERPPQLLVEPRGVGDGVSVDRESGTIDFGEQRVGQEGRVELVVRNAGGGTLEIESTAAGESEHFDGQPDTLELEGGESETISLVYAPEASGEHVAAFQLETNIPGQGPRYNVTGSATPPPEINVEPAGINFDDAEVGETVTETVTVENQGEGTLDVRRADVRGDSAFTVRNGGEFTLESGEQRELTVEFTPESEEPQSTSLVVTSNDPTNPNTVVYVTSSNVEATVEVDEENRLRTQAVARNSSPENPAQIAIPDPVEDESYETDSVSVTPETETDVAVNVTTSSKPLETTPDDEQGLGNGTEQLGNVSVDANLANDDIREVEFRTRVDTAELAELQSDAGNVSLYRYNEEREEWVEKETEVVGQRNGKTILQTSADGASEWTAAAKAPAFDITETNIDVTATTVDDEVTIEVLVTNTGGTDGSYEAELLLDEEIVDQQERTVPNDGTVGINFERSFENPGLYTVQVNDVFVGEVNVSAATEEATVQETDGTEDGDDGMATEEPADGEESPDDLGPGFGVTAAVLALLAVALYARRE